MNLGPWRIGFESPIYLSLLLVLPLVWWIGHRYSLSGLGRWRSSIAQVLRTLVIILVVSAIAGVHWIWISNRVTVIYLLDQSDSIPSAKRQLMLHFAIQNVENHRRSGIGNRAGLIVFGRESSIEFPPIDDDLPPIERPESYLGQTDATNIESALKLAQASFPENSAKRIVLITDGNETIGTSSVAAKRISEEGIGIDVIPVRLGSRSEVLIDKIDLPGQVRQGQSIDARVVIERFKNIDADSQQPEGASSDVNGTLRVVRRIGNRTETIADGPVTLDRDVNVIPIPHRVDEAAGYTYEAEFIPDSASDDSIPQNNKTYAFTYARGKGRVMVIENPTQRGEYDNFIDALRRNDIECDVRDLTNMFTSLMELQGYDSVILAGISRSSGEDATQIEAFSDDQIDILVQSIQQFGTGVLMIGGPESFGAGGWANTKLEEAMPVDFQIKNSKIEAVGALAMVMHASELAQGNYWQKSIARAALDSLGPMDYCGVVQYDGQFNHSWMWGDSTGMARVGQNKPLMRARLSRMSPGDMPDFDASLSLGLRGLTAVSASMKHMIVISDGDPTPPSGTVIRGFINANIKISTVAVGTHGPAGSQLLQQIAQKTGGNYYVASNPKVLPKIFMREARRVAKPLIFEPDPPITPEVSFRHETLSGIPDILPNISGFVLTQKKPSSLVEVPLLSPRPIDRENATLLAMWNYGLGRTAVFTPDVGKRWTKDWVDWPQYDQFFSQLVRWTMRPSIEEGKYQLATNVKDGKVQAIVTAMDKDDNLVNFLNMSGTAVGPDLKPFPFALKQKAPGRYVGEFEIDRAGSYILSVVPKAGEAPLTTGVSVPFSTEYRIRQTNSRLLEQLADYVPQGGSRGKLEEALESNSFERVINLNPYRNDLQPARSIEDVWPFAALIGGVLFFADVLVRRVAMDPIGRITSFMAAQREKSRKNREASQSRLDRLRGSKSKAADELRQTQSRFGRDVETDSAAIDQPQEPATNSTIDEKQLSDLESLGASSIQGQQKDAKADFNASKKPNQNAPKTSEEDTTESYTARLLEAKRKARGKPPNEKP